MRQEDFEALISTGEIGGVELKSSQSLTSPRPFKIIKAALGLSNRRDGGYVIVGVAEDAEHRPVLSGMEPQHLSSWTEDAAVDVFAEYGEPRPEIRINAHEDDSGKRFVIIRVHEFHDQPVLCKRDGGDGELRRGALYVRPRGRAQTVENGSMEDMRALLELATEKRLGEFIRTVAEAELRMVPAADRTIPSDADLYDQELGGYVIDD